MLTQYPILRVKVFPCPRELHDGLAAGAVVPSIEIFLPMSSLVMPSFFFDAQLHGKPVRVPARLAVHEIPLLCLVAAKDVLDRAGHDMVDAGHPVGRRGAFVEYERGVPLARGDALVECVAGVPFAEHVGGYLGQVEAFILIEFHGICVFYFVRGRTPAWPEVPENDSSFFRQLCKDIKRFENAKSHLFRPWRHLPGAGYLPAGISTFRSTTPRRRRNRRRYGRRAVRRCSCRSAARSPVPCVKGVDLVEPVENLGAFLLGDADARIADVEPYPSGALREPDRYRTFCREFQGIAYEIAEYLVQSLLVILELEPGQAVFQPQDDPSATCRRNVSGHLAA